ncbi:hypothetical protein [Paenibacillus crassostreae]|uniref:Helicase XPB/Ssl2 N-terminal domain-containing protein n=1 Tax=Paenibacillus crassostreae TaxID=1763538 RepID=A0A167DKZ5_9BACL|nr:hypothetical protein [Paenibacillus crassostreae]AOZ91330.1 hypothetical protein LPB68_03340 [Paenibacillus crassostreae]OAB74511.1 hypothetical protein PNBC_10620 [Paenibacillus crassostreae]
MNLADMLTFADIGQLTTIASHYQCECRKNSKHELIQSILVALNGKDFIGQQIRSLSVDDLRFLNAILFDSRNYFNVEELIAIIKQTSFADVENGTSREQIQNPSSRETIARFKKSGWLFNGLLQDTKYLYQVPRDLKERFRKELGEYFKSSLIHSGEPAVYREEQGLLVEDLDCFLRYVHQHEIEMNHDCAMYRRNQQQLMESFHISEPLLSKGGWRFGYGKTFHLYPSRLSLIYDYALHMGYIDELSHRLIMTKIGLEYLEQGKSEDMVYIFRYWLRLYKRPIPNLNSIVYWIGQCCHDWVTLSSLYEAIGWLIKPFYYDTSQSIIEQRIIQMMMHLGFVRIGESEGEGTVVKMTLWGNRMLENDMVLTKGNIKI